MNRCANAIFLRQVILPVFAVFLGMLQGGMAYSQDPSPANSSRPAYKAKHKVKAKQILMPAYTPKLEVPYTAVVTPLPELGASPTVIPLQALTSRSEAAFHPVFIPVAENLR